MSLYVLFFSQYQAHCYDVFQCPIELFTVYIIIIIIIIINQSNNGYSPSESCLVGCSQIMLDSYHHEEGK